jgi:putative membrane protein
LKQIAANKSIDIPSQLNTKDSTTKDKLSKLSGNDFDRAYMADMVKDHVADVGDFQKEGSHGRDTDIKNFAEQTLPTLKDHLQQARSVDSSVKKEMSSAKLPVK